MADLVAGLAGFSYSYPDAPRPALRELELELAPGEFVVCAGRSGSGKSTLLEALCGLVPHYRGGEICGELEVCGLDVREHGPAELGGIVGFVGQDSEAQVISATVRGELELPLELRGEPPAARARAIEEVALALGIAGLLERPTGSLSGGELQRVALAAALVLRPRAILLDEPTSQLDPVAGDELIGLLRRLNEEWGMTVVIAEHRLERCLAAADRVLALAAGELAFDGDPHGFCDWAIDADPTLVPPVVELFALAGLRPLAVSVKEARRHLALRGLEPRPGRPEDPAPAAARARRRPSRRRSEPLALDARDLWVELDSGEALRPVLRGIGLRVRPGERVALMGRNGAGKSTLLRVAAGLVEPARGAVHCPAGGALLPQSASDLFLRERVADELPGAEGGRALAEADLAWARDADPRDLSGGERQRLALAIVTAGSELAGAICLDEPTRGMDGARKLALAEWLRGLTVRGSATIVATHDVEFAARYAERVVLLGDGEVIADGPADEVLAGGWYFATEVARALGGEAAVTAADGAELLRAARPAGDAVSP